MHIAKWLDNGTTECLQDDGVHDWTTEDLIELPYVSLVRNAKGLKTLQRMIEKELDDYEEKECKYTWKKEGNVYKVFTGNEEMAVLTLTPVGGKKK